MQRQSDSQALSRAVDQVLGRKSCDLALVHACVVDVFGRTLLPDRTVLVAGDRILAVVPSRDLPEPRADQVVDCQGRPLIPGLMDAHVHIESSLMTPEAFARAVLACGTTRVVADPHEIANVSGTAGLSYMLAAGEGLPVTIHVALPSCVPCTPFEDAGAVLTAEDLAPFWRHERVCSLGEVMNCPGVLAGDRDLLAKVADARAAGRRVDGHCPGLTGLSLQAYAGCGIGNDHEETDPEKIAEHIQAGLSVFVREGSAARSLSKVLPAVTEANAQCFCFCTDDLHAEDILGRGHINAVLAKAVRLGLPAPTAVAMASLNTARCFGFDRVGAVAPGWLADLVLLEDLTDFRVAKVWCAGVCVHDESGTVPFRNPLPVPEEILGSVHLAPLQPGCLRIPLPSGRARIIRVQPHDLCTGQAVEKVALDAEGCFSAKDNPGLCKIAVFERHKALGLCGLGILRGYAREGALLGGALATSISHDSHNIVVAGSSDSDMLLAVEALRDCGGGIALVKDGELAARLELPVAGLMTQADASEVARRLGAIQQAASDLAVSGDVDPVMTLSFMALCVIPSLRVHTRGLFDAERFQFVSVDAGEA